MPTPILQYATPRPATKFRASCVSAVRAYGLILATLGFGAVAMILIGLLLAKSPREQATWNVLIAGGLFTAIGILGACFIRAAIAIRRHTPGAAAVCARQFWFLCAGGMMLLSVVVLASVRDNGMLWERGILFAIGLGLWLPVLNAALMLTSLSGRDRKTKATAPPPVP